MTTDNIQAPIIKENFQGLNELEIEEVRELITKNLDNKADTPLKKIYSQHGNAEVKIDYQITKTKQDKFDSSFRFWYNGDIFVYKNKEPFKYLSDLINHAFDHFTRHISDKK